MSYGLIVWGQARKSYLYKLLKLQKRTLRFIYFSDRNHHAIPLFSDAGILPVQFSYYELTANLMFDIKHRNAQEIFETCLMTFPMFTTIIPDPLLRTTFTHKALGSLLN